MPINLTQLTPTTKLYTPKWFDKKLTGSGKKTGILCAEKNPYETKDKTFANLLLNEKANKSHRTVRNGTTTTTIIPLALFPETAYDELTARPLHKKAVKIADYNGKELHAFSEPYIIVIDEQKTESYTSKNVAIGWNLHLFYGLPHAASYENVIIASTNGTDNKFSVLFTGNIYSTIFSNVRILTNTTNLPDDLKTALENYVKDLSLYQAVADAAEYWNTEIQNDLEIFIQEHQKNCKQGPNNIKKTTTLNILKNAIQKLEQYTIPLDIYREIYKKLNGKMKKEDIKFLSKQNINLLMSDTLENMNKVKAKLKTVPKPGTPWVNAFYSAKQKAAIQSTGPLTLVQAGAGVGKSQCILGRMEYMEAAGIDPKSICVLSFTNAAANHILEKQPNVRSNTIASMIHEIYKENWQHELSKLETLINCMDIYFNSQTDPFISEFKHCLIKLNKNDNNAFTCANNFIEDHMDEVLKTLDVLKQTSLELEQIICYQMLGKIKEPTGSIPGHIIVDEVQDTSIFEFVFILNYTIKHKTGLFMVGDCSQTLYEFRSSNPRALNTLEASGIFDTYALDINYRSNQEILDFANTALMDIEANQYAKIQLHANNLTPTNKTTFSDKVKFLYRDIGKMQSRVLCEQISIDLAHSLTDYIKDCFSRKEQVAVLAYSRSEIAAIEKTLITLYPSRKISNLVPKQQYTSTIMSKYIKKHWDETAFYPINGFLDHVEKGIMSHLNDLIYVNANTPQAIQDMLGKFHAAYGNLISTYAYQVNQKMITKDQMRAEVKNLMLKFEIQTNAIKQSLNARDNEQNRKDTGGDFVLSTIHSAKGLEFDNVIVIYRAQNDMAEPEKRMYYVAMTRAMKTEYVCAYGNVKYPKISVDYAKTIERLPGLMPADFTIPGLMSDDKKPF